MGKPKMNKYRRKRHPMHCKRSKAQRLRLAKEKLLKEQEALAYNVTSPMPTPHVEQEIVQQCATGMLNSNNITEAPDPTFAFTSELPSRIISNICVSPADRTEDFPELVTEHSRQRIEKSYPSGRFICDIAYVISQARNIEAHSHSCNFGGRLIYDRITYKGLASELHYICSNPMCGEMECIKSDRDAVNLNKLAVLGALSTGSGFSQEEEKFSTMNIRYMTNYIFSQSEKYNDDILKKFSESKMEDAVSEEKRLAELRGDKDEEGHFNITVVVDGGWCKRSYGHGYNASSGVGVIIGMVTRKILFIGVRNKLCLICRSVQGGKIQSKEHFCFKNWNEPSTGMESDAIVQGMNYLQEMYQVKCSRIVGDGDSNTMCKIREKVSYGSRVLKVECANHAVRRYRRALEKLQVSTAKFSGINGLKARKLLKSKIPSLVTGARSAIKNNAVSTHVDPPRESVNELIKQLQNSPDHTFGKHGNCGSLCTKKEFSSSSEFDEMSSSGLLHAVKEEIDRTLVSSANTLIFNATNNAAETFMSSLCKTYGGKRVDFSRAGGINRRANIAVLSYQAPAQGWLSDAYRALTRSSPKSPICRFSSIRKNRHLYRKRLFSSNKFFQNKTFSHVPPGGDKSYGEFSEKPDLSSEMFSQLSENFFLKLSVKSNDEIELATRGQSLSERWRHERSLRISSSHFKEVADRRLTTLSSNLVKRLIYKPAVQTQAMKYGLANEAIAMKQYQMETSNAIQNCGLFVDMLNPFLCTSPDGLIGDSGLVEIKCPYSAKTSNSLEEVSKTHAIGIKFKSDGTAFLPTNHQYFYQIQGQLAITNRSWCDLYLWCRGDNKTVRIYRDQTFWNRILPKLKTFYMKCILPELLDPRASRNLPLREPAHIIDAIEKCQKKKKSKT